MINLFILQFFIGSTWNNFCERHLIGGPLSIEEQQREDEYLSRLQAVEWLYREHEKEKHE